MQWPFDEFNQMPPSFPFSVARAVAAPPLGANIGGWVGLLIFASGVVAMLWTYVLWTGKI